MHGFHVIVRSRAVALAFNLDPSSQEVLNFRTNDDEKKSDDSCFSRHFYSNGVNGKALGRPKVSRGSMMSCSVYHPGVCLVGSRGLRCNGLDVLQQMSECKMALPLSAA